MTTRKHSQNPAVKKSPNNKDSEQNQGKKAYKQANHCAKESLKNSSTEKNGQKEFPTKDFRGKAQEFSLEEKLAQMEKNHLYLRAEIENMRRQNIKERSQLLKYGAEHLARDLLETLDVFKSALDSEVSQENYREFIKGVQMTSQSLKTILEKHGIKELDCVGKAFDPNTQEALSSEISDEHPEGHVTRVFKAPYLYHDRLLRPGQVIVSRTKTK